jgi:hypothetical protein
LHLFYTLKEGDFLLQGNRVGEKFFPAHKKDSMKGILLFMLFSVVTALQQSLSRVPETT